MHLFLWCRLGFYSSGFQYKILKYSTESIQFIADQSLKFYVAESLKYKKEKIKIVQFCKEINFFKKGLENCSGSFLFTSEN